MRKRHRRKGRRLPAKVLLAGGVSGGNSIGAEVCWLTPPPSFTPGDDSTASPSFSLFDFSQEQAVNLFIKVRRVLPVSSIRDILYIVDGYDRQSAVETSGHQTGLAQS